MNTSKRARENTLTDEEKIIPGVNDVFEKKHMIEDLKTELTGSLTKIS